VRWLLVLWDVDYTLVDSDGVGRELYQIAFREMFGRPMPQPGSMSGRTDRAIAVEVLGLAGVAEPQRVVDAFHGRMAAHAAGLADLVRQRSRVLLIGIGLALLLRGAFIAAGAAALNRFDWVLYVFGAMLLITAARLGYATASQSGQPTVSVPSPPGPLRRLLPSDSRLRRALPPVLALAGAIALADLVFALDSIPAVFGLTRDPLMVLTVNAFALLGLRHLYYLIGGLLNRLAHLSAGLAAILAFIGVKLLIEALAQNGVTRLGPVRLPEISTGLSLCVIGGILAAVTVSSLVAARRSPGRHRSGQLSQPAAGRPARSPHRPVRPSESGQLAARSVPRSPRPGHAYPP